MNWNSVYPESHAVLRGFRRAVLAFVTAVACAGGLSAAHGTAEKFSPLDLRQVKVGGEIGRRIDNTIFRNLMVIDVDKEYLAYLDAKVKLRSLRWTWKADRCGR